MYKKVIMWAAALLLACCASAGWAQTITIVSGQGQLICQQCAGTSRLQFDSLVVKVVNSAGQPVAGATVTWALTSGSGYLNLTSTITGTDGTTSNFYSQFATGSTIFTPYAQSTITASTGASTVTFYETLALTDIYNPGVTPIFVNVSSPSGSNTISGALGSTGTSAQAFTVKVTGITGTAVPNIGVLLAPSDPTGPTVACAGAASGQPGLVMTDASGTAVCTPTFGGKTGTGQFVLVVGGVASSPNNFQNPNGPFGFTVTSLYNVTVTPGVAGSIVLTSGNNQSVNPGQSLAAPLVATVTDISGNPISGAQVTWTVSPANAATLSSTTSTSDASGRVQTSVSLAAGSAGLIQVTAALASNPNAKVTFNVTANVVVSGLQKVSGDNQDAAFGTVFANPLVVQVSTASGATSGIPVQFNITSGTGTLSTNSAVTDGSGRAQVTVNAGPTVGPLVVVASAGGQSVTFNLTIRTPGPTINSNNFFNGVGFQRGGLAPCGIGYLTGTNLATGIQGVVSAPAPDRPQELRPLPLKLANVTVQFGNVFAPLFYVSNIGGVEAVSFQVPCEVTPGTVPVTVGVGGGNSSVNVQVQAVSPGILSWTDTFDNKLRGVIVRPDGTLVQMPNNPARRGEIVRMYATGLGPVVSGLKTGQTGITGTDFDMSVTSQVIVGVNNQGVRLVSARYAPNLIGLYEVVFEIPADAAQGDLVLAIGVVPQGGSIVYSQSPAPTIPVQ